MCELLRDNLYELYKYISRSDWTPYFTLPRVRSIAHQCLTALAYIHSLDLIHCDLKPENVLIKSLSRCVVKVAPYHPPVTTHPSPPSTHLRSPLYNPLIHPRTPRLRSPAPPPPRRRPLAAPSPHHPGRPCCAGDRLRLELFHARPPLVLRTVALVPCARGRPGPAVQPESGRLVARLHPRRALHLARSLLQHERAGTVGRAAIASIPIVY